MKYIHTPSLKSLWAAVLIGCAAFFLTASVAQAQNNVFPEALNDWQPGEYIESDWADAIEEKIGADDSEVSTSLDYRVTTSTDKTATNLLQAGLSNALGMLRVFGETDLRGTTTINSQQENYDFRYDSVGTNRMLFGDADENQVVVGGLADENYGALYVYGRSPGSGAVQDIIATLGEDEESIQLRTGNTDLIQGVQVQPPTLTRPSPMTADTGATLRIEEPFKTNNNLTITDNYSLFVDAGVSRFDDAVGVGTSSPWGQLSASSTTSAAPTLAVEQQGTGPVAALLGGPLGIGTTTPDTNLHVYDDATTGATNNLITHEWVSPSPADNDTSDWLSLFMANSDGERFEYAKIQNTVQDITAGSEDGSLKLYSARDGMLEETARFDQDEIIFNDSQSDRNFLVKDTNGDVFTVRGNTGRVGVHDATPDFQFETVGSSSNGYFGITESTDGDIFTVDEDGDTGIGVAAPTSKLDVNGTTTASGYKVDNSGIEFADGTVQTTAGGDSGGGGGGAGSTVSTNIATTTQTITEFSSLSNDRVFQANVNTDDLTGGQARMVVDGVTEWTFSSSTPNNATSTLKIATSSLAFEFVDANENMWNIDFAQNEQSDGEAWYPGDGSGFGLFFKRDDGTKAFGVHVSNVEVCETTLSTAWDSTTAGSQTCTSLPSITTPRSLSFKDDGTKMYVADSNDNSVQEYTVNSAWDSTDITANNSTTTSETTNIFSVYVTKNGEKMYLLENSAGANGVHEYDLTTPWDVSSASFVRSAATTNDSSDSQHDIFFRDDGERMYIAETDGSSNPIVEQWTLSTPWDISTASRDTRISQSGGVGARGIFFREDDQRVNGSKLYRSERQSSGTPSDVFMYDIGIVDIYSGTTTTMTVFE